MRLIHYSREPLQSVYSVQQGGDMIGYLKPSGLWVSVDGECDWLSWCQSNDFGIANLRCQTEVVLADDAKLLRISTAKGIDQFTAKYVTPQYKRDDYAKRRLERSVDWQRVASKYQGIIISPYIWSRRLDSSCMWYYGWDCASGCIWDAAAVQSLCQIKSTEKV